MANYTKVGTLVAAGSTGDQAVTGLGFQPSAVVFIWNPTVTTEDSMTSDVYLGLGVFADDGNGIQEWSQYLFCDDNVGTGGLAKADFSATKCLKSNGHGEADAVSLDSDGFTINWSTAAASGQIVYYMAYNALIFEASAGTMTLPANPNSVTVSGLPFAPAALIVGTADSAARFSVGISANHGDQSSPSGTNQEAVSVANFFYQAYQLAQGFDTQSVTDYIAWRGSSSIFGGGLPQYWQRDQWNSDGFRITNVSASSYVNTTVAAGYLALRLTNDAVHRSLAKYTNGTGSSPYATSGIWPLSGFLITDATSAATNPYMVALGLVDDDLEQRSCWIASDAFSTPSSAAMFSDSDEAIKGGSSTAGTDAITLSASISDWGNDEFSISRSVSTTDRRWYGLLHGSTDGSDGLVSFVPQIYRRV